MNTEDVTLTSGVILRVRGVPPLAVAMAKSSVSPPPIPQVPDPNHDGNFLPNPYDPDYQQAEYEYRVKVQQLAQDVMLSLGTEVLSVPSNFPKPESDEWVAKLTELEQLGLPVDLRVPRLAWLKYFVIENGDDIDAIMKVIYRKTGVREEDVAQATESFRDNTERGTDPVSASTNGRGDGDTLRGTVDAGDGDRV